MDLLVKQIMQRNVRTVSPNVTLPELEKAFVQEAISGFPVVDQGELVGIVSRSDIVRQLVLEHHVAERTSDFYFDQEGFHEVPAVTFDQIADRVGERIEQLQVKDVMSRRLVKISPNASLKMVAQTLTDHRLHRVLVTEDNRLLGIVSSLDLVELIANGRVRADNNSA